MSTVKVPAEHELTEEADQGELRGPGYTLRYQVRKCVLSPSFGWYVVCRYVVRFFKTL